MATFFEELKEQRWDDHRFYHHSRVNQTLHLISACSFVVTYALLYKYPVFAALFGWTFAMCIRQVGHFFFEPKGYDHANDVSHEHKEAIKVGYNLRRKVVLMSAWALSPAVLWLSPSLFGLIEPSVGPYGFLHDVGLLWLALGVAGIVFRVLQLWLLRDLQTGVTWAVKILTDPFYDIRLYWKSPLYLLRGQLIDPEPNKR